MSYNSRYRTRFSPTHGRLDLIRLGGSNCWCEVDGLVPFNLAWKIIDGYRRLGIRTEFTVAKEEGVPPGWLKLEALVSRECGLKLRAFFKQLAADPTLAADPALAA
jgi:hypothetical protein